MSPLMLLTLLLATLPTSTVERDGVRIETSIVSGLYTWEVTNVDALPLNSRPGCLHDTQNERHDVRRDSVSDDQCDPRHRAPSSVASESRISSNASVSSEVPA